MDVTVILATYGHTRWKWQAYRDALPSVMEQGAADVIPLHQAAGTLASCRNAAAAEAETEWLCFLDADDRLGVGYLDAMRTADMVRDMRAADVLDVADAPADLKTRAADALTAHRLLIPAVQYVNAGGGCTGEPKLPAWGRPVYEVNTAVIGTLVPRQLFLDVGGFHEQPIYEDWDLWLRCLIAGARPIAVPDAVYCADAAPGRNLPVDGLADRVYWQIRNEREPQLRGVRWE